MSEMFFSAFRKTSVSIIDIVIIILVKIIADIDIIPAIVVQIGDGDGAGAEILPFSPLADEAPAEHADSCWLPGGYPELHVEALAAAKNFAKGLLHFAQTRPVHGECGGYMVLGQSIEDSDGRTHAMTGLLAHSTSFAKRKLHLGYRAARLLSDGVLGPRGAHVRGHEFHYASLTTAGDDEPFAELSDSEGRALGNGGGRRGRVSGTFFHAIAGNA